MEEASAKNREELAWAAGFIDGEGCFGFYTYTQRSKPTLYGMLKLDVSQANREPLDRLQKALGVGHVTGPHKRKNPKWAPIYHLQVYGIVDILIVVEALSPWLCSIKRTQVADAITAYNAWDAVPNRPKRASNKRHKEAA